jgi:3-dehydroquinate synthase
VLRGVRWGAIPTTLVGMVDAAIGGKTGVNHPMAKNVIGAFWQPSFVYAFAPFLETLSERQLFAGVGELIKYAGLTGGHSITDMERLMAGRRNVSRKQWEAIIAGAVAYKARLVSHDERDTGVRQFLNLGHTFGHGIEQSLNYRSLLHGEAVLVGLYAALKLSSLTFKGAESRLKAYRQLVETSIGLVPYYHLDVERVLSAMQLDKKRLAGQLHLVLLKRPGNPVVYSGADVRAVRTALAEAIEFYMIHGGKSVTDSHH